uniref:Uncharacterized protein n=1 Tax=Triticum urartu TaxID=4572 RepID=A0A8R7U8D9_TRIUA
MIFCISTADLLTFPSSYSSNSFSASERPSGCISMAGARSISVVILQSRCFLGSLTLLSGLSSSLYNRVGFIL